MEVVKRFRSGTNDGSFSTVQEIDIGSGVEREEAMAKVVHFEIPADDTTRAREFWSGLFGVEWRTYEGPVEYHMFANEDEQSGGGLMPRQSGQDGLVVYFAVEDIDAAREKAQELGGAAEDKQPVPGMGWFAPAKDTEGNEFSFWQNDENAPNPDQG
jgi:uncharacterized protein